MRCYTTPEDTCEAICDACAVTAPPEHWKDWRERDPATQPGLEPIKCSLCGTPLDL